MYFRLIVCSKQRDGCTRISTELISICSPDSQHQHNKINNFNIDPTSNIKDSKRKQTNKERKKLSQDKEKTKCMLLNSQSATKILNAIPTC